MAQTIFRLLVGIEKDIKFGSLSSLESGTKFFVKKLSDFIESGCYTDSSVEKFIAANFRLSAAEITKKWNSGNHGKTKNENTFRGQISVLSSYICTVLDVTVDSLNAVIVMNDKESIKRVQLIIDSFVYSGVDTSNRFRAIKQYIPETDTVKQFSLSECQRELEILKTFDAMNLEKIFKDVDFDKLLFLINLCKEPLVDISYVKSTDKKRKDKVIKINKEKLAFCTALNSSRPLKLQQKQIASDEKNFGVGDSTKECEVKYIEVSEKIPYKLDISKTMADEITKVLKNYEDYEATHKGNDNEYIMNATMQDAERAEMFLKCLTIEGTKSRLRKVNPYSLYEIVNRDYIIND